MNKISRCKCYHRLRLLFCLCRSKMQLVQWSLVFYQGHTFLKAWGGEPLLILMVMFMQPGAQTGSSPRQQFHAGGLCCPSDNCCEFSWWQFPVRGLYLHAHPQQRVLPLPLHCLGWSPGLHKVGLGCYVYSLHCKQMNAEKTRVVLGHTWGSMYISRASEIYVSIKTLFMIFSFP